MTDNKKPKKKPNKELYKLISSHIINGEYVFLKHAKRRLQERNINDLDVLHILEGKRGRKRKRNKSKDKYESNHADWNYCIEGVRVDNEKVRIVISFTENLMLVITIIRLKKGYKS